MRAALGVFLLVCGCGGASQYAFFPATANARVGDRPAEAYRLPVTGPHGEVRVTSLGETDLRPAPGRAPAPAILVRLVVDDDDAVPWFVDTRRITLKPFGREPIAPAEVQVEGSQTPIVKIPRGEERTIDLYFPLAATAATEEPLPGFDVVWQVRTGAGEIARHTRFLHRQTSLREHQQRWSEEDLEHGSPVGAFWRDDWNT
jgi:hypothetical protein